MEPDLIESRAQIRLTASGISCARGGRVLYDGLSFSLAAGDLLLLTGPNGSGKTSLLRQIAGLLPLDAGSLVREGFERAEETHFVGHIAAIKGTLTASENLAFWCDLYGSEGIAPEAALAKLKLASLAPLPARVLSAGQKRRLALARLVAVRRKLWLLDEPDTALDAEGRAILLEIIAEHRAQGGMIVMASHGTLNAAPSRMLALDANPKVAAA
jgi:heme exporter protein A